VVCFDPQKKKDSLSGFLLYLVGNGFVCVFITAVPSTKLFLLDTPYPQGETPKAGTNSGCALAQTGAFVSTFYWTDKSLLSAHGLLALGFIIRMLLFLALSCLLLQDLLRGGYVCVYYCSTYYKAVREGGGGDGGHVLRETTSRGRCELVCPSRTGYWRTCAIG
jgi:hypothetical protein